jgi:hypothetical protein
LTDIGAEGFHFAALFGNEDAEATSAGGDDADGHESGEAAAAAVAAGESSGEATAVEGEANASALESEGSGEAETGCGAGRRGGIEMGTSTSVAGSCGRVCFSD